MIKFTQLDFLLRYCDICIPLAFADEKPLYAAWCRMAGRW